MIRSVALILAVLVERAEHPKADAEPPMAAAEPPKQTSLFDAAAEAQ